MPFKYMAAIMFGNGLSGISMNILRAILQLALPGDENSFYMALIFAIGASSVLVAAGVIFTSLFSNPFFLYYLDKSKGESQAEAVLDTGRTNDGTDQEGADHQ